MRIVGWNFVTLGLFLVVLGVGGKEPAFALVSLLITAFGILILAIRPPRRRRQRLRDDDRSDYTYLRRAI